MKTSRLMSASDQNSASRIAPISANVVNPILAQPANSSLPQQIAAAPVNSALLLEDSLYPLRT